MSEAPAIEVHRLLKAFGAVAALKKVSLTVPQGRFAVLLGPNGAGKTTLLRILATLTRPTSGTVHVLGKPVSRADAALRREIGLISHQLYVYPQLTAAENLRFYGDLYGLAELSTAVERALDEVDLRAHADTQAAGFSRGMLQRLSIARALLHRPSLVLLDEPFTGLDHHAASVLAELLTSLKDGERTFVMVSHNLQQAASLGDIAHVLVRGRYAGDIPLGGAVSGDELAASYGAAVQATGRGGR